MKKNLIWIVIVLFLSSAVLVSVNAEYDLKNDVETVHKQNYEIFLNNYGAKLYQKCPVMQEPITPIESDQKYQRTLVNNLPSSFSWRNDSGVDWTTEAKHQGNCGSCWAFATVASLESRIKIAEGLADLSVDLSEQYILSCLSEAGSCYGGSGLRALQYILNESEIGNNCNGIIPESCMSYQASHDIDCSEKCQNWKEKLVPITSVHSFRPDGSTADREQIKTVIQKNGPVAAHIAATRKFSRWGLNHHDEHDYFPEPIWNSFTNHLVMICGWKDDPTVGNGGYWICKNSWGDYWGYDGFFNVEYGALHIDDSMIVWAEYHSDDFDWKPIADAGSPKGGHIGQKLFFTANQSFDDEEIISYHWDFGDGRTSNSITSDHQYDELGEYQVVLTVTDSMNQRATDIISVWIQQNNTSPETPIIQGKKQGESGNRYEYQFTSNDAEGNDIYYYIDWGDNDTLKWIGPYQSGNTIVLKKRWNQQGTYTIKVKTKDVFDEESSWATQQVSMAVETSRPNNLFFTFFNQFNLLQTFLANLR